MIICNYKTLRLSFNLFHNTNDKEKPEYWEMCLLKLKDGRHTAGAWSPSDDGKNDEYIRGQADTISVDEVEKWHELSYDISECLEEDVNWINLGSESEEAYSFQAENFKSFADGDSPPNERFCLLILTNGELASGRWDKDTETFDTWNRPTVDKSEVWAWTALSHDLFSESEEEWENEIEREKELNKNPSVDEKLFKYGTDINTYYEKALLKLREKYPWATLTQMMKKTPWQIVPHHGKYVFGTVDKGYRDENIVSEWTEGTDADEFIAFLCEYAEEPVANSDPAEKFKYGTDIEVYLNKAYENVKKDYKWLDKNMLRKYCLYGIEKIDGELEFVRAFKDDTEYHVCDYGSADKFLESLEQAFQEAAIEENPVIDTYDVPFGHVEIHGWNLEIYRFSKLKTGDYMVTVQAGDRVTGGTRRFFITPDCFKTKSYEKFLDRYLKIVPGESFGLSKKELLSNEDLKKFLGFA